MQRELVRLLRARGIDARAEVRLPATSDASRSGYFFADVGVYLDGVLMALGECKTHQEVLGGYRQRTNYEGCGLPYRVATCETWFEVADWLTAQAGGVSAPPQLELPPPVTPCNPEHLRYAEELAAKLNEAQAANGRVDRDTYRPVAAHHRGTLGAALAIKNAGVPLTYATQYVWLEGQRYKPSGRAPQIASLAYLERGCIAAFRALEAKHHQRVEVHREPHRAPEVRPRIPAPIAVGEVLAGLLRDVRPGGSS